jgi:zinc protease
LEKNLKLILILIINLYLAAFPAIARPLFKTLQWKTKNGARVIFYQAMEVPMVDISIAFAAGSAYDGNKQGVSVLTTRLLNQGNNGLNASTVAEELASTGAQYEGASNQNMVALNLKTLTNPLQLKKASQIFSIIINHPDFPTDAFNREKNQQLMAIKQTLDSPEEIANQTFFKFLYKDHPYAHPTIGTQESVNRLTNQDIRDFYHQYFVSRNAVIVLVGAIDKPSAQQLAETITNDLPKGHSAPKISSAKPQEEEMNIEVPLPSSQTVLRLGQLGIDHHSKHYFPLQIGNYILGGGGLNSRLAHELREKRGLTYGVYSQFSPMPGDGPFLISLSTKNNQAKTAIDRTRQTLTKFVQEGPTQAELKAAKHYLTGSFPLSLSSNRNIANMLLKTAFYHLPNDFLDTYLARMNQVSTSDIKEAFQHVIMPDKLIQISVGKP